MRHTARGQKLVTWEPSIQGAFWKLSRIFGQPFSVKKLVLADEEGSPPLRPLSLTGRVGLGQTERDFDITLLVGTSVPSRVEEWGESEAVAFQCLSDHFAGIGLPFAVSKMRVTQLQKDSPTDYGPFVAQSVWRTVNFEGTCGYDRTKFSGWVSVYDTLEVDRDSGQKHSWGWDWINSEVQLAACN